MQVYADRPTTLSVYPERVMYVKEEYTSDTVWSPIIFSIDDTLVEWTKAEDIYDAFKDIHDATVTIRYLDTDCRDLKVEKATRKDDRIELKVVDGPDKIDGRYFKVFSGSMEGCKDIRENIVYSEHIDDLEHIRYYVPEAMKHPSLPITQVCKELPDIDSKEPEYISSSVLGQMILLDKHIGPDELYLTLYCLHAEHKRSTGVLIEPSVDRLHSTYEEAILKFKINAGTKEGFVQWIKEDLPAGMSDIGGHIQQDVPVRLVPAVMYIHQLVETH
jgi:hypothetical protein